MFRLTTLRAAAAIAALGAIALAGCGGGGSKSVLPQSANAATGTSNTLTLPTANGGTVQAAQLSVTLPNTTSAQAQSTKRAILSTAKKPTFIDTTSQNSSLVVSVSPNNAAEAAQYGNLTVCYNLYVNGTLQPTNLPNYQVTAVGNVVSTVTLAIPAPPGTDGFQITQYNGLCGSTPYSIPTPPAGNSGASNILAQTPVTYADIEPGLTNNLNNQIANCPLGSATVLCPAVLAGAAVPPAGTFAAAVTVASVAFGTVPITNPVREQGAFIAALGQIGIPIPLEAKDAAGSVIPGLTTVASPLGGAGFFPSGVTVTDGDSSGHTKLYLIDASTGAIAQGPGTSVTIHEFNVLNSNTVAGFSSVCGTGAQSCSDAVLGGNAGDPWVIVLTYDGTSTATTPANVVVTATATVANAALSTPITTTITPQSAVYSAGGSGYADAANPTAPAGLISVGASNYFTDGNSVKIDGTAPGVATTATALGGLTSATWPNTTSFIYAVDSAQAGAASGTEQGSGLFAYNAALTAALPVSASAGANNYITFQNPVAVVQGLGAGTGAGHPYLYVVNQAGGIYRVDISGASEVPGGIGGFQEATDVLPLLSQNGTALSPGTVKVLGTAALTGGQFLIGDPGNNRIAMVDATAGNTATITTWATCPACTGLFVSGTSAYATSTTGQIYYISAQGAAAVSLGFTTGAAVDGPLGQIASFTPAAMPTLTPVNYLLQFQSKSFFDTVGPTTTGLAAPYTLAPFGGSKVFATAPTAGVGLIADTSAGAATAAGVIKATGGIIVVPNTATASAVVTPDSILFVDSAGVGGKIRTIAR
jgi:hypothetical protein